MKLNLGCCDLPLKGWVNIDSSTSPHIKSDLTANVLDLSEHFSEGTVEEIYAGHLVEHLYEYEAMAAVAHWNDLLKTGGKLAVCTPDFRALAEGYLSGRFTRDQLVETYIFSYVQESVHRTLWDAESLKKLLAEAGFINIKECDRMSDPRAPFGVDWQVIVEGEKA